MPTREDMRSLREQIVNSYDERTRRVAEIRSGAREQIEGFGGERRVMAQQQRTDLAKGRVELAQTEAARRVDEAGRSHDRAKVVTERKSEVDAQLQELDQTHSAIAEELRADMAQAEAIRKKDEANRAHERAQVVAERKSGIGAQLQELDGAHNAMAKELRANLSGVSSMLRREEDRRKSEVNAWLVGTAAEHREAHDEWQELAATMWTKRSGAVAVAEAPAPVVEEGTPAIAVEVAKEAPIEEEGETVEDSATGEATDDLVSLNLSDRFFEYLANHPDGTRLVELEREFGASRFQAGLATRHLIQEGKAEKRELLYFAV